jgi:hypothetical protein
MNIPSWVITLGSSIAAYIGGILTEPIKDLIARRRLRKALYIELGWMYARLHGLLVEFTIEPDAKITPASSLPAQILVVLQFDCHELAKKDAVRFNLLNDFAILDETYKTLQSLIIAKHYSDNASAYRHLKNVVDYLDRAMREKRLNKKLLFKIPKQDFQHHLRQL